MKQTFRIASFVEYQEILGLMSLINFKINCHYFSLFQQINSIPSVSKKFMIENSTTPSKHQTRLFLKHYIIN